nr:uncharacterized protein LOC128691831 [Cherax quadricarinatus]
MASSAQSTQSASEWWLIGCPLEFFSTARLPTRGDILRVSQFFHLKQNLPFPKSFKKSCEACCAIWMRARIPTQRLDSCVRKLEKLMREYQNLKKSRKRGDTQARIFQDSLGDLFDIGASDALAQMTVEEDRVFYQMQREDVTSCIMSGPDPMTTGRESRKRLWEGQEKARRAKAEAEAASFLVAAPRLSSTSSSSLESKGNEDFASTISCSTALTVPPKRLKNVFASPAVASAVNQLNLPETVPSSPCGRSPLPLPCSDQGETNKEG